MESPPTMPVYGFGSGVLYGTRTDIANSTPRRIGALQDVQIEFSATSKELFGQNQYPLDVARGKAKVTGKAKFAQISGLVLIDLFAGPGGSETAAADILPALNESHTVPASSPYTVTVPNSATWVTDLGVRYASTSIPLTVNASPSAAGQYSAASGVYTFSSADSGKTVYIDYTYAPTSQTGIIVAGTNPLMGATPTFSADFYTSLHNNQQMYLHLYQCVASKLTMPTKIDDYVIQEFDFEAFANASGNVYQFSVTEAS